MPIAALPSGIELYYETFGNRTDPTVVLIAGFGAQMISWDAGLCELLAAKGLHIVRFDNRDCGCSSTLDDRNVDLDAVMAAASVGDHEGAAALAPYTLAAMADDVAGLLDALAVDTAHIVGASMGGMIAQLVAARHPDRTMSLTSMMSSTGEPEYGQSTPEAMAALLAAPATDRHEFIEATVRGARIWASRRHFDEQATAAFAGAAFDRSFTPEGTRRQLGALLATGPLAAELSKLDVPTLVIHGRDDTLITPSGGERTAALVPGAELLLVDDMGHDRPEPLWPLLCERISTHVRAAEARANGSTGCR